jgi:hypothetical protein
MELLTEMEDDENDILDKAFDVRSNSRLGCQCKILEEGTIEVEITRATGISSPRRIHGRAKAIAQNALIGGHWLSDTRSPKNEPSRA